MKALLNKIDKKYRLVSLGALAVVVILIAVWPSADVQSKTAEASVEAFETSVNADGEVQALKFETINIPELMKKRELRIWQLKITNLVAEGTQVRKGDFIATLDPTDVEDRLRRTLEEVDDYSNQMESAILDSTITLAQNRDGIINILDNLEECKIKVEQSVYESKATQRQAKIELEKVQLEYNAQKRNYEKEVLRQKTKVNRIKKRLEREERRRDLYEELKRQLRISSPSNGMVVYGRSWRGRKIKVNDDVGPWMPIIATLPDLTSLYSEAIVKEIDIAKIKVGQKVSIKIDAFPDDVFQGEVLSMANVGQPIKGAGMNGFKVEIAMETNDKKVLPGMTTLNQIILNSYEEALVVPRECVFGSDADVFVFKKEGRAVLKTPVETGGENETHIRIVSGLKDGDLVLLSRPADYEEM